MNAGATLTRSARTACDTGTTGEVAAVDTGVAAAAVVVVGAGEAAITIMVATGEATRAVCARSVFIVVTAVRVFKLYRSLIRQLYQPGVYAHT